MDVITQLQQSRPEVVHLFDELVNTLPEGVNYTEVAQSGNSIELTGDAQSSTRVSALMRNIDGSDWLRNPMLGIVSTQTQGIDRNSQFRVTAEQISTTATAEGENAEGAAQ
jgi:type IV pilus assembly protein PilN